MRWYGLEYPCPYKKPASVDEADEDGVKWLQYMLYDAEYVLPVYKEADGSKPRGDRAYGINGVRSEEFETALTDFMIKNNLDKQNVIEALDSRWLTGSVNKSL